MMIDLLNLQKVLHIKDSLIKVYWQIIVWHNQSIQVSIKKLNKDLSKEFKAILRIMS